MIRTTLSAAKDALAGVALIGSTFAMTLMLAEASYAADKIGLICSDANAKDDYSLAIELDRKLASFLCQTCRTLMTFPLPELPRIMFGSKIKLCPAFIRKGSWIELPDRFTFFIGISTTQKTFI
jgi:hypothetical protein